MSYKYSFYQVCIDTVLRNAILKRSERKFIDRIIITWTSIGAKKRIKRIWNPLGPLLEQHRVTVLAFSDVELDLARQVQWGDYWFKHEITRAIGNLGFAVVSELYCPEIVVHLFGQPTDLSAFAKAYKILWIHSNPDKITPDILRQYDRIYCISNLFAEEIRRLGFECEVVQQGTSKRELTGLPQRYDVIFVGNARAELGGIRGIVEDMGQPDYNFKVWGTGYRTLSSQYWAGEYYDYQTLGELYASSCISLNDHRPAMSAKGFINPRVFDILAAGGFCISDPNPAITDVFGDAVPQYESKHHLHTLIDYYLSHPAERNLLAKKGQDIATQYRWERVATALLEGISPDYE